MNDIWVHFVDYVSLDQGFKLLRALFLLMFGYFLAKLISFYSVNISDKVFTTQTSILVKRIVYYFIFTLFLFSALLEVGFNLNVLLGAASVLTVAIGFASQTSASNFISGIFLMAERSFTVGDIIRVGTTTGEVLSIDLLSIKLRTFDNLFVRIPNESLIKSEVTTLTKFPIRRLDLKIGIAYKENIARVKQILEHVADNNPLCLEEPKPLYIFQGFDDSSLTMQFYVWTKRENFIELKNSMYEHIKSAFDEHGVEIPFPHISLYSGSVTEPFPIQISRPNK